METGRVSLRLFVSLLLGIVPVIVIYHLLVALAPEALDSLGRGTVLAIAVGVALLWAVFVTVVTGPIIGAEAKSMAEIAERGSRSAERSEGEEAQSAAQKRLAVALDDRNRQIAELVAWAATVTPSDPAGSVAAAGVGTARSVTNDPTWVLAVLRSTSTSLLAPGVYGPEAPAPLEPVGDLHRWASTIDLPSEGPAAAHAEGPWGAFVAVRLPGGSSFSATLLAPWEGRTPPSGAELELLTLVGQQLAAALDHSILYAQLLEQADELSRMQDVQRDFLRSVTHDLQTPLTSIGALAAEVQSDPRIGPQSLEDLNAIRNQADRLQRMVGQLLIVSRLEAGVVTARQEIIRPIDLVQSVWKSLRGGDDRLELAVQSDALVIADPDRVEQVLWALLDNAIKYSPAGGAVRVGYESRARVDSDAALDGAAPASELVATLSISDQGMGMNPETRARAFEQFYRADDARRLVPDGSGVGLFAAHGLVELMGGRLSIESRLGSGTTIAITLPAEQTTIEAGDSPASIDAPTNGST